MRRYFDMSWGLARRPTSRSIWRRSGGHPLFLTELAAADDDELPSSVREAVAGRVDGLGAAAATVRTAAILGSEIDIDLLAGVLDISVADLLQHLDDVSIR